MWILNRKYYVFGGTLNPTLLYSTESILFNPASDEYEYTIWFNFYILNKRKNISMRWRHCAVCLLVVSPCIIWLCYRGCLINIEKKWQVHHKLSLCTVHILYFLSRVYTRYMLVGCVAQWLERRSLTGELSLASTRSVADVWPLMWV